MLKIPPRQFEKYKFPNDSKGATEYTVEYKSEKNYSDNLFSHIHGVTLFVVHTPVMIQLEETYLLHTQTLHSDHMYTPLADCLHYQERPKDRQTTWFVL